MKQKGKQGDGVHDESLHRIKEANCRDKEQ
jgi:hypothetical protein